MFTQLKNRNFYIMFGLDLFLFVLAYVGAYLIRFEFQLSGTELNNMISALPLIIPFKVVVFYGFGLYRGMWRYAGLADLWRLFKASLFSSLIIVTIILLLHHFQGFSRAVFILDGALTFLFTGGIRILIRLFYHRDFLRNDVEPQVLTGSKRKRRSVFIIGAGDAGEKTLRELKENQGLGYEVVGFIDDSAYKKGRLIHNVPVLGGLETLSHHLEKHGVNEVLIAAPSATGAQMRRIIEICEASNVRYKTLPGLGELINGKVSVKALRDVDFQDLLGRPAVEMDEKEIQNYLEGKCILVTGAGGTIGSELCRQIVRFVPEKLLLLDACEENLYNIQMELKHQVGYLKCIPILGRIQDLNFMEQVFTAYKPQVVFHAAAYKHVPMLERNPWEAVYNNIRGAVTVMKTSIRYKAEYFLQVSTDKAVRPTNVMGASKRVCELIMQSFIGNGTNMMAVRFGNVTGSSGSVIPLFRKQIERGGPVTVTHPEITRYFMTIQEASQLILQAGALGEGGEIFILEMGTPVKISQMAHDLIRLSGKEPGRDIEITYTGLRQGEKLYEELISEGEGIVPTIHEKILVLKTANQWNGMGDQENFSEWLMQKIDELYTYAHIHDACNIREKLKEIVPEYEPKNSECVF